MFRVKCQDETVYIVDEGFWEVRANFLELVFEVCECFGSSLGFSCRPITTMKPSIYGCLFSLLNESGVSLSAARNARFVSLLSNSYSALCNMCRVLTPFKSFEIVLLE